MILLTIAEHDLDMTKLAFSTIASCLQELEVPEKLVHYALDQHSESKELVDNGMNLFNDRILL